MAKIESENKDREKSRVLFCSVFFLLSLACIVFGVLLIAEYHVERSRFLFWTILFTVLICIGYLFSVRFVIRRKETLAKTLLSLYIFALFVLILLYILKRTGFFAVLRDEKLLQVYLQGAGVWMPLLYILLQFLQVVILPIPSIVSTIAGIALFGALKTLIYSLIGIMLGSFLAFYIGRKLGNKAVSWMVGTETLKKWQRKLKGKDNLFLSLMFLLPLFPDDILCFLAGLSTMSWGYFSVIIIISRVLALSLTCFSIDFIPFNTWWGITLWCVFAALLTTLFIIVYKNLDIIQKKINDIKAKRRARK